MSKIAGEIFVIKGTIDVDSKVAESALNKVDKAVNKTSGGLSKFASGMQKFGSGMARFGENLTKFCTIPLMGLGAVSLDIASDAKESAQKFGAVFGDMTQDAQNFVDSFSRSLGKYDADVQNMMSTTMGMAKNYGLAKDEGYDLAESMQQLTADVAAFNNMQDVEVHERLIAALRGEGESAEILNLAINQTTLADYARRQGITKSIEKMTEAEKVELRYGLMLEQTKDMQGYAAKESDSFAAKVNRLKNSFKELAEKLGDVLLPLIQPFIDKMIVLVDKFIALDQGTQESVVGFGLIAAVAGPLLMFFGKLVEGIGSLIKGIQYITPIITGISAPIVAVVGAIAAVIGAVVYFYNTNEGFRNSILGLWESVKEFFSALVDFLTYIWVNWGDEIMGVFNWVLGFFKNTMQWLFGILDGLFQILTGLISGNWEKVQQGIQTMLGSFVDWINNTISWMWNGICTIFNGALSWLVDGTKKNFEMVKNFMMNPLKTATEFIKNMIDKIKGFFDFEWEFPKLKMPHFNISGKFSLSPPSVPKLNVDWYSEGGIFNSPTIIPTMQGLKGVGDANHGQGSATEVVAPLADLRNMIEDLLNVTVVVPIDGKVLTKVVAKHSKEIDKYNQARSIQYR